ncbi:MAG TPA: DUF1844 domain-containing protein [Candidatus Binatia bacterium]|nr:DUF1844 domain-containing protein [Candidatus Binatia bacterium]
MAEDGEKTEAKGFTVKDRRRFSPETGEAREGSEEPKEFATSDAGETVNESQSKSKPEQEPLPEINFSTFIISLSTQALMHLGEIPNPLSGKSETDIPVAKQTIDILGMLEAKTRGNRDASEERLMEDVLFDLRMKYVEAVKKK